MDSSHLKPGDSIPPCQDAPTLRARDKGEIKDEDLRKSEGYTSRGYIRHFLPDREVNLAHLNQALADVFGEPALLATKFELEIDESAWRQLCSDPWSGNLYRYAFRSPETIPHELDDLRDIVNKLSGEIAALQKQLK